MWHPAVRNERRYKDGETKLGIGSVSRGPDGRVNEEKQRQPLLCRVVQLLFFFSPLLVISFCRHGVGNTSPARLSYNSTLFQLNKVLPFHFPSRHFNSLHIVGSNRISIRSTAFGGHGLLKHQQYPL